MPTDPGPEGNRLDSVALITLVLGVLDLVRWAPEIGGRGLGGYRYLVVVVFDLGVGVLALVGGAGLRRRSPEGWRISALAWGALAASSGLFGGGMIEAFLRERHEGSPSSESFWLSLPRALFYVLALSTFPYVLWVAVTHPRSERPSLARMGMWFGTGSLAACCIGYVLLGM